MIWSGKSFIEFYKSFLNLIKLVSTRTCSSARVRALAVPILLLGCLRASSTLRHRLRAGQTPRVLKIAEFRKESSLYEKPLCSRSNVLDFNRKIQYRDNWDEVFRSIVFLLLDDDLQNAKFNLWLLYPVVQLWLCFAVSFGRENAKFVRASRANPFTCLSARCVGGSEGIWAANTSLRNSVLS